ncbi:MAG: excinuclease ABC subunit UvrC [Bdellovibrionota bacterium]
MATNEQRIGLLLEKAREASSGPGVYRMLGNDGKILYIGKAKSLTNRVRSYFQASVTDTKTKSLVTKVHDFDVILTQSESEALILESILIKRHKPRYNIALKDDKSYPYVVINEGHTYPKLVYMRRPRKTKNQKVYGPFASANSLRAAIRTLNRIFRLRDCTDNEFANRSRPCINHQIGICTAPCTSLISVDDYRHDVESALQVLSGHAGEALDRLKEEMHLFSEREEFEQAARVRDQITALEDTIKRRRQGSSVEREAREGANRDVVGWHRKPDSATIAMLFVRGGNLVDSFTYHLDDVGERSDEELVTEFLAQLYLTDDRLDGEEIRPNSAFAFPGAEAKTVPAEILLPFEFPEIHLLEESLLNLGHKTKFVLPQKGAKHEILQLAERNAENAFDERQREKGSIYRVLAELKAKLRLENYPRRMECFDISNLGDTGIVASRVTFIEGKPEKSLYRHYKVRSITSQNDFAAMREVIERRLVKVLDDDGNYEEPPDLLIIDGGKGQLGMAMEVMKELNLTGIDLVSLAKGRTVSEEDRAEIEKRAKAKVERMMAERHGTDVVNESVLHHEDLPADDGPSEESQENALTRVRDPALDGGREVEKMFERVFKPGRMNPIVLAPDAPVTHLLQRIRDEAHRFAVEFQRKQRKISK